MCVKVKIHCHPDRSSAHAKGYSHAEARVMVSIQFYEATSWDGGVPSDTHPLV